MLKQLRYTISHIERTLSHQKTLRCMNCGKFLALYTIGLTGGEIMVHCYQCKQKNVFEFK